MANDAVLRACRESPHILRGHILRFAKDIDTKETNEIKSVLKKKNNNTKEHKELSRKKSVTFEGRKVTPSLLLLVRK